jgi:hypothetical protein
MFVRYWNLMYQSKLETSLFLCFALQPVDYEVVDLAVDFGMLFDKIEAGLRIVEIELVNF